MAECNRGANEHNRALQATCSATRTTSTLFLDNTLLHQLLSCHVHVCSAIDPSASPTPPPPMCRTPLLDPMRHTLKESLTAQSHAWLTREHASCA